MRTFLRPLPWLGLLLACPAQAMEDLPAAATPDAPAPASATPEPAPPATAVAATTPAADADEVKAALVGYAAGSRVTGFRVERNGLHTPADPQATVRLQARADGRLAFGSLITEAALALDAVDGTFAGNPTAQGDRLPGAYRATLEAQEAWAGVRWKRRLGLRAGMMSTQWGIGLVANDGRTGLVPDRSDWFTLNRGGDRGIRFLLHTSPLSDTDSALRGLVLTVQGDNRAYDDQADEALNQSATQIGGTARLFLGPKQWVGFLTSARASGRNGGTAQTRVGVFDVACDLDWRQDGEGLRLQAEAAYIAGHTTFAPTPEFPVHDVRQAGAMARGRYDDGDFSYELDLLWTSGDEDLADADVTAFRADRNLRQGLVLFEHVLAWQTARARLRASDPNIVGQGPPDVDLYSTDGAVTGAVTIFPKAGWKPLEWLEVYGGVLVALATARPVDPFATQAFGGGQARNALGATPSGRMLGTEIDLGLRATLPLPKAAGADLRLGVEHGLLLPGGAIDDPDQPMGAVQATRVVLGLVGR